MRSSLISTLIVVLLACAGIAYAVMSGPGELAEFDYSRFEGAGDASAPVRVAIVEDLRCPGCRKSHMGPLTGLLDRYRRDGHVIVYHVPYPVTHADSMRLAIKARSYAQYHHRPQAEVDALLFEADSTHLSLDEAEALLVRTYGAIPAAERSRLDADAETALTASNRYLASVGIANTPSVIVNGVLLRAPKPEVAAARIDAALAAAGQDQG